MDLVSTSRIDDFLQKFPDLVNTNHGVYIEGIYTQGWHYWHSTEVRRAITCCLAWLTTFPTTTGYKVCGSDIKRIFEDEVGYATIDWVMAAGFLSGLGVRRRNRLFSKFRVDITGRPYISRSWREATNGNYPPIDFAEIVAIHPPNQRRFGTYRKLVSAEEFESMEALIAPPAQMQIRAGRVSG